MKSKERLIDEMKTIFKGYDLAIMQFIDFSNKCNDLATLNAIVETYKYNGAVRRVIKLKSRNR